MRSSVRQFAWRAERRLAFAASEALGWQTAAQLGGWRRRLLAAARRRDADLFIAHSALTIWVAARLSREGRRVGVDMEDWFSREHAASYPSALVARAEREVLLAAAHATCPSHAMSDAIAAATGCRQPTVIYNAFRWTDRERLDGILRDRKDGARVSIHWYSQTLGQGRGLEELFASLPMVKENIEIHLRGTPAAGAEDWIRSVTPPAWRDRIFLHRLVSNAELLSRIAEHDIGFAGERREPPSRDLSVTNKVLQYLLAGLATVASDTQGQSEVARSAPGALFLYRAGDPAALAARINELAASAGLREAGKKAALEAARDRFCWERCEAALVSSVERALRRRQPQ